MTAGGNPVRAALAVATPAEATWAAAIWAVQPAAAHGRRSRWRRHGRGSRWRRHGRGRAAATWAAAGGGDMGAAGGGDMGGAAGGGDMGGGRGADVGGAGWRRHGRGGRWRRHGRCNRWWCHGRCSRWRVTWAGAAGGGAMGMEAAVLAPLVCAALLRTALQGKSASAGPISAQECVTDDTVRSGSPAREERPESPTLSVAPWGECSGGPLPGSRLGHHTCRPHQPCSPRSPGLFKGYYVGPSSGEMATSGATQGLGCGKTTI